jgi:hypothetical protein
MIEASLSRLMVATQQVWENMKCFDSQKAVVKNVCLNAPIY